MPTRLQRPLETISPPRVITKSAPTQGTQAIANRSSRLLKKSDSCFDRLSTNGKSPTIASLPPFALSLSKGERRVFQQPARSARSIRPALVPQGGSQGSPLHKGHRQLQLALSGCECKPGLLSP